MYKNIRIHHLYLSIINAYSQQVEKLACLRRKTSGELAKTGFVHSPEQRAQVHAVENQFIPD